MEVLISVIVPVYKVESYLEPCIHSVVRQTHRNLEIILVDDGSPDRCGAICDQWCERDRRIRVIHKENGGLSDARNAGLELANGDYIAFVDSDDLIAPTMLEELLTALELENADLAECGYACFTDVSPEYGHLVRGPVAGYTGEQALSLLLEGHVFQYTVWNKLYRRELFQNLRFEVGKLHEDVFFTYQAFGMSKRIAKTENALYFYRQRSGSIMGSGFSLRTLDSLEARRRQYFYIKKQFPALSGKAQSQVLGNCLYLGQKALRCPDTAVAKSALEWIQPVFHEIYRAQTIEERIKQKLWYYAARRNFGVCCSIRNFLKLGL